MCPMQLHHHSAAHGDCGMAGMVNAPAEQSGMNSCPMNRVRHSIALVFVLATPQLIPSERRIASTKLFSLPFAREIALDKFSPPPRTLAI
jgi:hypothetical protein